MMKRKSVPVEGRCQSGPRNPESGGRAGYTLLPPRASIGSGMRGAIPAGPDGTARHTAAEAGCFVMQAVKNPTDVKRTVRLNGAEIDIEQ